MDGGRPDIPNPAEQKAQVISNIINNDRQAFQGWLRSRKTIVDRFFSKQPATRLDLPNNAARYLIPSRLYELVENPKKVKAIIDRSSKDRLGIIIAEEKSHPVKADGSNTLDILTHSRRKSGSSKESIGPNDHVLLSALLCSGGKDPISKEILEVITYTDRDELQGQGVGSSFYERLRDAAKQIGFRYIFGANSPRNIKFFTDKLGRIRVTDLPPHLKKAFTSDNEARNGTRTVDILYPEDLIPPQK